MKKNIILLITLFIASTVLVAAEGITKDKKAPLKKAKKEEISPAKEVRPTKDVVQLKIKKRKRSIDKQAHFEKLRKEYEKEKFEINDYYKAEMSKLKTKKNDELKQLKDTFKRRREEIKKS